MNLERKITVKVPIVLHGEARGVKQQDGILDFVQREVEIECLPGDIPEHIDVDVSGLLRKEMNPDQAGDALLECMFRTANGRLTAADYEDGVAHDPRIDALRSCMVVRENPQFTADYYAADKRFIGNAIQVFFRDGTSTGRVHVDCPIGHRRRRTAPASECTAGAI